MALAQGRSGVLWGGGTRAFFFARSHLQKAIIRGLKRVVSVILRILKGIRHEDQSNMFKRESTKAIAMCLYLWCSTQTNMLLKKTKQFLKMSEITKIWPLQNKFPIIIYLRVFWFFEFQFVLCLDLFDISLLFCIMCIEFWCST